MRRLALLGAAVFAAGTFATSASADKPFREPVPPPPGTTLPIEGICSFDVELLFLTNKEYILTFGSGSQIITGQLFVRLTNLATGTALDLNISGPGFTAVDSNVFTLSGRSLIFFFPGDLGPGAPGVLLLTSGPVVLTFGETSVAMDVTSASVTDLCAALA